MVVDVLYDGLPLQTGATAREEQGGAFIELDAPMPVGTRLTVRGPDGSKPARVERVREGVGAGVLVRFLDANAPDGPVGGDTVPEETEGNGEPELTAADGADASASRKDSGGGQKKRKGRKGR